MNVLLAIVGLVAAIALTILKALAMDEIRGRIQRHIRASVESTITSLPPELAAEWADEWRAELAAVISMPVAAARLGRGLATAPASSLMSRHSHPSTRGLARHRVAAH
jgi:hypothetical protein